MNKLLELITNSDGNLSTTNCIQMIAIVALALGFIISVIRSDSEMANSLGWALGAVSTLTASSKGFKDHQDKRVKHAIED